MFKPLLLIFSIIFSINGYLTDNSELRKQYNNFLKFAKKTETESSFELFIENLNKIVS